MGLRKRLTPRLEATEANAEWIGLDCDEDGETRVRVRPLSREEMRAAATAEGRPSALATTIASEMGDIDEPRARARFVDALADDERAAFEEAYRWQLDRARRVATLSVLAIEDADGPWDLSAGFGAVLDELVATDEPGAWSVEPGIADKLGLEVAKAVEALSTLGKAGLASKRPSGPLTPERPAGSVTAAPKPAAG